MKKIIQIFISKASGDQILAVGNRLLDDNGKETDISVTKITTWFGVPRVYFSDGSFYIFKNVSYQILKK